MTTFQWTRTAVETWEVQECAETSDGVYAFELIGRVTRDGRFYYVDVPHWHENGYQWHRIDKPYMVPDGAKRALQDRKKRAS